MNPGHGADVDDGQKWPWPIEFCEQIGGDERGQRGNIDKNSIDKHVERTRLLKFNENYCARRRNDSNEYHFIIPLLCIQGGGGQNNANTFQYGYVLFHVGHTGRLIF